MNDREPSLQKNPYMRTFYDNPPPPTARPITTNLAPNPYHDQGPRHLRPTGRLGTYSLQPDVSSDMVGYEKQRSSSLIAAALGPSQLLAQSRPRPSPLGTVRRTHNPGYYDSSPPKSSKRKLADQAQRSSSELSEHDDDDFSPATTRRLAPTPVKKRMSRLGGTQRRAQRYFSDEDYDEAMIDDDDILDEDAREEEALMRAIARR